MSAFVTHTGDILGVHVLTEGDFANTALDHKQFHSCPNDKGGGADFQQNPGERHATGGAK